MLDRVKKLLGNKKNKIDIYREASIRQDVDASLVLLEGAQGKNYNGNMFYLLREIENNSKWKDITPIFVSTKERLKKTKNFFKNYNFSKVKVVVRDSKEYAEYLATAKYLFTDNSFPTYMVKRKEQIYVNTWHGTPIKHLGISDLSNATSLANIQKNYFMCDYALFPNNHTRNVFLKDYDLTNYMQGKCLMCDYPRNDAFYDAADVTENVQKIAYMPTWRGSGRIANVKEQKNIVIKFLNEMDKELSDQQILYVNLHFLVGNDIDFEQFHHVKSFPTQKETYDFLKDCDLLISDYSSVIFDFAISKKPIILYTYDRDEYENEKGTYISIDDLPFPVVEDIDSLLYEINHIKKKDMQDFYGKYCMYGHKNASDKVLELILHGNQNELCIQFPDKNHKKNLYVYGDNFGKKHQKKALVEYLNLLDKDKYNIMLGFKGKLNYERVDFLENEIPDYVSVHCLVNGYTFTLKEKIELFLRRKLGIPINGFGITKIFEYQKNRFLGNMKIDKYVQFVLDGEKMVDTFSTLDCHKSLLLLPYEVIGFQKKMNPFSFNQKVALKRFDKMIDLRKKDMRFDLTETEEEKEEYYNQTTTYRVTMFKIINKACQMNAFALFKYFSTLEIDQRECYVTINDEKVQSRFLFKKGIPGIKGYRWNICYFRIPHNKMVNMTLNNRVRWCWKDQEGFFLKKPVNYGRRKNTFWVSAVKIFKNENRTAYYRASDAGVLVLTVRPINYTDKIQERLKLFLAAFCAKFKKQKKYILLYEKNCARYEESASILYEKMIDRGYEDIYFVLENKYFLIHQNEIKKKYRRNIVRKNSFRHYLLFFISKTFISSESIGHALETRCCSRSVRKRIVDRTFDYVFLQHGIMYMISLDSASRKMFSQMPQKAARYRVVVSSELEAEHFINLGNHEEKHVYLTGLCKFDKNQWNQNADKIVIMPTWRPWEYNDAEEDLAQTNYYKMLKRMISAVPNKWKENLIVLPHPLIAEAFRKKERELADYLPNVNIKYDVLLRDVKVLVTDYSSISYDAFYRGANVIFYWEELEECLKAYGDNTKLMLNKDNVFGDICYNKKELEKALEKNFYCHQKDQYLKNYQKIVKFHDGKNTERLIECLKADNII